MSDRFDDVVMMECIKTLDQRENGMIFIKYKKLFSYGYSANLREMNLEIHVTS